MAVPFLPFVLKNLNSLIQNEVGLLCGVNTEMKKLSSTLSTIQAVLEDAEQKQLQDKVIQNWLKELNDAAYEADDILDECATEALRCELKNQGYGSLKKVSTSLNGKRYLIVLDDVWDENPDKWDAFKYSLACGSKGASVIVTTRVDKVASIMGTISPHRLSVLSKEDCWLLFRQRAFGLGNEERPNIVAIGKEIVKKCGGVPLAAKALGGLMRFKSEEKEWLHVKESEIWKLPQDKNSILPALRLSYFYLPLESRQCFAYCAIFPKGSQIRKRDLIHLWMANGYISCKGGWEPEDIGDQIWNELCLVSFFQEVKDYGSDVYFKMHDLVHDLAQSIMKGECQMIGFNSSSDIYNGKAHHLTLVAGRKENFHITFHKVVSLRTLRQQHSNCLLLDDLFLCDFRMFGSLRAFDAPARVAELPPSIGNAKHLRYLNLSDSGFVRLPDSICNLLNLQTLILEHCHNLERLPQNMMYLRSLRHLFLSGCRLIEMPPKIGQLTNLKTLNEFVVGESTGCSLLAELKCLNLQGELCIWHLERVRNPMDAKEANLVGMQNLSQLQLKWACGFAECESQEDVKSQLVLEALQPHPNLKKLDISGYIGTQFPLWMRGLDLQNVVNIRLSRCNNCLQLPPLGQLPLLQSLEISVMKVVGCIENEYPGGGGFPSLEELTVRYCPKLEGLSREEGRELFPRLRKIIIAYCPKLSFPHLSAPKNLWFVGECAMVLNSISNLNGLTSLTIGYDNQMVCFPKEFLRNLTLLESLVIKNCGELKLLPRDLASLVTLKSLKIKGCPKLESLPEEGVRGLESLQSLHIINCCELERRCKKGKGEDWCCHALWVTMAAASIEVAVASDALLVGRFWVVHGDWFFTYSNEQWENKLVDDPPVRGTRSLSDIYQRCNVALCEPADHEEALKDPKWKKAMEEEMSMIHKNKTWELVNKPEGRRIIGVKWVYRTKLNADNSINKHKARLVVKGYAQIFGADYSETFAPPEGFVVQGEEDKVYLLKKALYSLKQAPKAWYSRIDEHLLSLGFTKSLSEATLYVKQKGSYVLIVSLYVDDLLVTGDNAQMIEEFKQEMMQVFEMTDLGLMTYFLGLEVQQSQNEVFICQKKYAKEILKKFQMEECKAINTPMGQKEKLSKEDGASKVDEGYYRSLIGCLMYLTATRPDILFVVSLLSRFMHCASEVHLRAAKRVLRFIKGSLDCGVNFEKSQNFKLSGFSDSDWGGSVDDMKSTSGYCFNLGSGVFSWCSKKQEIVAQSTAEAEFIAATAAANQALWLRKVLSDLHMVQNEGTEIFVDNQAAIAISRNPVFHGKTKHFNIKLYFLREVQQTGKVKLAYCKSEDQLADLFTKPLPVGKFELLRKMIGICNA
ncbi:putative disease resistance protein RGA4 [Camellia sinensis]|uniref:putative disease resistance protein RGA4 n=1 Tax=Camellia sinensis TaxID=4442 RepID=UPI001036A24C|nr:putative disease resistance protein RGA4 [Camellia sinensis]